MNLKTITLFLIIFAIISSPPLSAKNKTVEIPSVLREYIGKIKTPCELIKVYEPGKNRIKQSITSQQAMEDIKMLEYIFNNGYSGKDYFEKKGISFGSMFNDLRGLAKKNDKVKTADMESIIEKHLSGITDGHLKIFGTRKLSFYRHKDAYFTDLIMEKRGNRFYVFKSKIDNIPEGSIYTGNAPVMFPTLSPPGKRYYLVGKLSFDPVNSMNLKFGGKAVSVPLHPIKLSKRNHKDTGIYSSENFEGVPFISLKTLNPKYKKQLDSFVNIASSLKKKDGFILDLSNNHGGSSYYAQNFVKKLNGKTRWVKYFAFLKSPATLQATANIYKQYPDLKKHEDFDIDKELEIMKKNPSRKWEVFAGNQKREMGDYKGKAIIISNRNVASSGEAMLNFWQSIPNGIIVGENSGGIGNFGDVRDYMLPNSGITLMVPCKLFIVPGIEEGVGYMPHYWIDSEMPELEIIRWLKAPEIYEPELEQ